jgi:tetratricopeptide (TPR) repeat protein
MKIKAILFSAVLFLIISSCSKDIDYSTEHINQTSGRYLYNLNEVIDVYYRDNTLFVKWKGNDALKPVALDENTFFIPDMYKKLRFVKHPETKKRYLGIVSEDDDSKFSYDFVKVADSFKTAGMHLADKNYEKATLGYLEIQAQDSTSVFISERQFNRMGYEKIRKKEFEEAIGILKMNVALFPDSDNTYDSLAAAYAASGDSLNAYTNYKKALELNTGNETAKQFIAAYNKNQD